MTIRPDNLPWRLLWEYVSLWDDPLEPPPGLGGETDPDDQKQKPQAENPDQDEPFDDDESGGEFEDEEDVEDEVPIGDEPGDESGFEITEPENVSPQIPGFAVLQGENNAVEYLREFDSWWEFAQAANDTSLVAWNQSNRISQRPGDEKWTGTASFTDAIDMALRRGWPKGRELLRDSLIAIRPRPKVYESLEFEVAGAFPCVPVYCAGDPAWMIFDPGASIRSAKPIVRIDYNHWVHASVDINSMMLRGAAIVSLADGLEKQGLSVELRIIGNSKAVWDGNQTFRYSIVYKRAGEPLDLDRAAFAIAHPSSMRRLAFAILEQHKELESSFKGNYGAPMYQSNPTINANQSLDAMTVLFVPGPQGRETPQSAQEAVTKAAEKLLDQLNQKDLAA